MSHLIIGTAGHVDHGKTSLIRRLTGIDTDRLKEEKERGLSIDLGFAYFTLPSGRTAGIVDVPGHERFIKNMLAGAHGMDLVLLVIAADEGVMPQTIEHLSILQLLEVRAGLIVLTKTDRVDAEWVQLMEEDVRDRLSGTLFTQAPVVRVSSETGEGFEQLVEAIDSLCENVDPRPVEAPFRLPVDRVFSIEGFGTVVTGTTIAGLLKVGDSVEVLPQGISARVRTLEVHDQEVDQVEAGQRVAINLSGVPRSQFERGNVVATPGLFPPTVAFDTRFTLLKSALGPLKDGAPVRLHLGTAELLPRIYPLGAKKIDPGQTCFARFRFDSPIHAAMLDRFVVRSYSPMTTVGGGIVLDLSPTLPRRNESRLLPDLETLATFDRDKIAQVFLRRSGSRGSTIQQLAQAMGLHINPCKDLVSKLRTEGLATLGDKTGIWIHRDTYDRMASAATECLSAFHKAEPLRQGMPRELLREEVAKSATPSARKPGPGGPPEVFDSLVDALVRAGRLAAEKDLLRLADYRIAMDDETSKLAKAMERAFIETQFNTPDIATVLKRFTREPGQAEKVFYSLVNAGALVRIGDLVFHKKVVDVGERRIREFLSQKDSLTVSDFRSLIDSSRKYAVPLLEYYDKVGVTRRVGDTRILKETKS